MTVVCLIAGTGTVCLTSRMARHTAPFAVSGSLQNLSVSVTEPLLRLPQLRLAYLSRLFVY